jgi:hypothetical protein
VTGLGTKGMRVMVRFKGAFSWYNAAQVSVGDGDSGLRAVLESTAPGHWSLVIDRSARCDFRQTAP